MFINDRMDRYNSYHILPLFIVRIERQMIFLLVPLHQSRTQTRAVDHVTRKKERRGRWTAMTDVESHLSWPECCIRWKIGRHTFTALKMVGLQA